MTLWEYKILVLPFDTGMWDSNLKSQQLDEELNQLGAQGWELVSLFTSLTNGWSKELIATFKRPR